MYATPTLATRFARNTFVVRSEAPLAEDQMRRAAPSIFAQGKHASRSDRYTYIPTIDVLRGLKREGFEPFMVAQSKSRIEGKTEFTKHMIRMRHITVGADSNLSHRADRILSQGWKPTLGSSAVDKCRSRSVSLASSGTGLIARGKTRRA
jgi:hypothetical protein